MFQDVYILQGAKNIVALFKQHSLSAFAVHGLLLQYVFSLPERAAQVYFRDDSGEHQKPHTGSAVEPRNRVDFLTRSSFHKFLTGPGLAPLNARFEHNIIGRLGSLAVSQEWTALPDFMDVFHHNVTSAVIDAMCGPFLLLENPTFTTNFWNLDDNLLNLFVRKPRFLASSAYKSRDSVHAAVKKWHSWAKQNFVAESIGADGDDPYWGTMFFRDRQDMFFNMDGFDADAVASQELAFLWG